MTGAQIPGDPAEPGSPASRFSPFRRLPQWEPRDRWLSGRPQLGWPDTILSPRVVSAFPRVMLVVAVITCGLTVGSITDVRGFWILLGAAILLGGWQEWWMSWRLSGLPLRLVAFGGQWLLGMVMVAINPLACLLSFTGFMIAGTLFTGAHLVLTLLLVSLQVAVGQVGGIAQLGSSLPIYVVLVLVNFVIALAFVTGSNRREEAVAKRDSALRELLLAQQTNERLRDRLVQGAHRAGIREERSRLARELHDTVAQSLVGVITQLEAIDADDLRDGARVRVSRSSDLARAALTEARRAVDALGPAALEDADLPAALAGLLVDRTATGAPRARIRVEGEPRSTPNDAVLIRICQESLSNIDRHAAAAEVTITVTYLEDEVLLDIVDDGVGFDPLRLPEPSTAGGHGLPTMRQRLELAGGRLTVESAVGDGTSISAAVPG